MKTRKVFRLPGRLLPSGDCQPLLDEIARLRRALDLRERQELETSLDRQRETEAHRSQVRAMKALCADYAEREHILKTMLFALRPELRRVYA